MICRRIPDELEEKGYRVIKKLSLSGTAAFIASQFKKHRRIRRLFRAVLVMEIIVVAVFFTVACFVWHSWKLLIINTGEILLTAIGLSVLLVPIHEAIHAFFFKLIGVQRVHFGIEWKQFLVFASADRTPINYRQYRVVALAPFVIISIMLLVWLGLSDSLLMQISIALAFFIHLNCCWGDLIMMLYFRQYRYRDVITIDDLDNRVSYFLEKNR